MIAQADLVVHEGVCFEASPADRPGTPTDETLAVVRDQESWSRVAPLTQGSEGVERFGVSSFRSAERLDNSGFAGWLCTHLEAELGTGVSVVCASNRACGGSMTTGGGLLGLLDWATAVVRTPQVS